MREGYSADVGKHGAAPSWPALHEVLRDRSRNFLFNHLALREDEKGLVIRPDCADLPYFLRAYFAFKLGLPFGYSTCTRARAGKPPQCTAWWNTEKEEPPAAPAEKKAAAGALFGSVNGPRAASPARLAARPKGLAASFANFLDLTVADTVHSGSGRAPAGDDNTDYYPVALTAETLRTASGGSTVGPPEASPEAFPEVSANAGGSSVMYRGD